MMGFRQRLAGRRRQGQRGQVFVELALIAPILLILLFACLQFAIIFDTYLSVMNVTRDSARWIAIHPHTTDSAARTAINARLPSNIDTSKLTITFSPACSSLSSGKCTGRDVNTQIATAVSYNISSLFFVPTTFRIMGYSAQLPTTLPTYTIYMKIEPS